VNIDIQSIIQKISSGDGKAIARAISLIENEANGYEELMKSLHEKDIPVIGITGPPGAGKSTLTDLLIDELKNDKKKVAVLCVDPSSPFSKGALLGDRVRMNKWYNDSDVFIRSFATRGALGGLHPKMIEITGLMQSSVFDYIIIETVGVGQSEIEIAGLADITIVVLVPESGDEIQTMKAGLMEIADVFVVNKYDRPEAELFVMNLQQIKRHEEAKKDVPVIKTIATEKKGVDELMIVVREKLTVSNNRKNKLMTERAYQLILSQKMKQISKSDLEKKIAEALQQEDFNLYNFIEKYSSQKT
jgi:LAO/AO transport system kinase